MRIIKDNLASPVRSSAALERKKFVSFEDKVSLVLKIKMIVES